MTVIPLGPLIKARTFVLILLREAIDPTLTAVEPVAVTLTAVDAEEIWAFT